MSWGRRALRALLLAGGVAAPAGAQEDASAWWQPPGVEVAASAIADASLLARGGRREGRGVVRALVDLEAALDGARLLGIDGLRVVGGLQIQQGRDGSRDSGDVQVYSNIDGPDRVQLARLFVEQRFCSGSARVRVGKFDANDEFALVDAGVLHVHSSFGFTPTIAGFPSYPDPAFGALVDVGGGQGAYLRAAVMDGATQAGTATGPRGPRTVFGSPDGAFSVAETGFRYGGDVLQGRAAVGAWHHSGPFERADGATRDGLAGAFVNWEQRLP
jgi:carbohydrate-selective porin OprB